MSLTISKVSSQDVGKGETLVADVTFDNSYPWGGELVTAKNLGFRVGSELRAVNVARNKRFSVEFVAHATLKDRGYLRVRESQPPRPDALLTAPTLAIGTSSAAAIKITNATTHVVGGAVVEHASVEVAFTATTHDITADASAAQEAYYLISTIDGIDHVITKGTTAAEGAASPPAIPSNAIPIGLVKIVVAAGAVDFDATTDLLSESHLTVTYEDLDEQVYQATDLSSLTVRVVAEGR